MLIVRFYIYLYYSKNASESNKTHVVLKYYKVETKFQIFALHCDECKPIRHPFLRQENPYLYTTAI